jgi:hypothetical protein
MRIFIYEAENALDIAHHRNVRIEIIFFNDFIDFGQAVISYVYFTLFIDVNNEDNQLMMHITLTEESRVKKFNHQFFVLF